MSETKETKASYRLTETVDGTQEQEDWRVITGILQKGGFEVIVENEVHKIEYPSVNEKKHDWEIFHEVIDYLILNIRVSDQEYKKDVLPYIFKVLKRSYLFGKLFKNKTLAGHSLEQHIRSVASVAITDEVFLYERFVIRITALFHDCGKAFDVGKDELQYHAIISSTILRQFFTDYREGISRGLLSLANSSTTDENSVLFAKKILGDYERFVNDLFQIIRLHHIQQRVDENQISLERLIRLFEMIGIDLVAFGLLTLADAGSIIPLDPKYEQYMINNMIILIELVKLINLPENIKATIVSTLINGLKQFTD